MWNEVVDPQLKLKMEGRQILKEKFPNRDLEQGPYKVMNYIYSLYCWDIAFQKTNKYIFKRKIFLLIFERPDRFYLVTEKTQSVDNLIFILPILSDINDLFVRTESVYHQQPLELYTVFKDRPPKIK